MKRHQKLIPEDALPGSSERFAQSTAAAEIFVDAGYRRIGLDHFATGEDALARQQREGRLHRNFQGYTTDESPNLIGFGPSAIGSLPDGYVQNTPGMVAYREAIIAGHLATARGLALTPEDRLRGNDHRTADVRSAGGHRRASLRRMTPSADRFAAEISQIDELASDGIVERTGTRIKVPEHARALVRAVCAVFDAYAPNDNARYSRAS